jgi:hypothetical protein
VTYLESALSQLRAVSELVAAAADVTTRMAMSERPPKTVLERLDRAENAVRSLIRYGDSISRAVAKEIERRDAIVDAKEPE